MISGWRARLRQRLGARPPHAELVNLFPCAPQKQVRRWARAIAANDAKNRILCRLVAYQGMRCVYPLLRVQDEGGLGDLAAAGAPAILIFAHVGAAYGVAAGLSLMGIRTLLLVQGDRVVTYPPTTEAWHVQSREQPLLFLKRATEFLKQGGCVLMALDGTEGESFAMLNILGRSVRFPLGIQTLRKLTRAPVIPVSAPWTFGGKIAFVTHPRIADEGGPSEADAGVLDCAVSWLENMIVRDPRQLRSQYLGQFIEASRASGGG